MSIGKSVWTRFLPWLLAGLALAGCAKVGPNYSRPPTPQPAGWQAPLPAGLTAAELDPQALARWWTRLGDPILSGLVERAAAGSLDLKKALAKVREARARRGLSQAERFPTLDASTSATRSRSPASGGGSQTQSLFVAGLDAGWEPDLFGGLSRAVEAAQADLQASQEDLRDVLVTLLAEAALNYVEVRTYQARLAVAEESLTAQEETYRLTAWRFQAGLSDELTVQQARYNLESTRSQIPTLRSGLAEAKNRLAVLAGAEPGALRAELEEVRPIPVAPREINVGLPADLLRRRPDVRRAERQLAAQTARIGVATAELYPKLTLGGSIGVETISGGGLSSTGGTYSFGPSLSWRVFDAGAVRRNIEVQSALQEQYLIAYEAAVLGALKDVEDALVASAEEERRRLALAETVAAAHRAVELSQAKYQAGLADFSNVLEAQRSLLSFQDQLAQSQGSITSNLIRLYKAMGGGWTSFADEAKL